MRRPSLSVVTAPYRSPLPVTLRPAGDRQPANRRLHQPGRSASGGNNLFLETAAAGAPQVGTPGLNGFGTTLQNTLETSNVSTVEEMVNMITTQRAYEMNSKVISTADQML